MNNDFGPDSGLFLRSTEEGKCYQAMIDYHKDGKFDGHLRRSLGARPHVRNFSFVDSPENIVLQPERAPLPLPMTAEQWKTFWKHGQWNEFRARVVGGDKPTITTWINGVKIHGMDRDRSPAPCQGPHRPANSRRQRREAGETVRYRNIRVKKLEVK